MRVTFVVVLLFASLPRFRSTLPLCEQGKDSFGRWVELQGMEHNSTFQAELQEHYVWGGPGESLKFSRVWVPNDCAIHRFTNHTIHAVISHLQSKQNETSPLRIFFLGDSATRGVFCGLTRILAGSEFVGPCINRVCGGFGLPVSHKQTHHLVDVKVDDQLELNFMYVRSLTDKYTNWMVEGSIGKKPYAVIVNTGAWDFDHIARQHKGEVASEECDSEEATRVSHLRISPAIKKAMFENGELAKSLGVKVLYRNNHHNTRFGTICADQGFEAMLEGSGWDIWDNRRISEDVWKTQSADGFHFDRHGVNTMVHHQQINDLMIAEKMEFPGMLEIQFAQSLLFTLFRDALAELLDENGGDMST